MSRVSVCMASYNGEKYISEQLESILGQLSHDDEIIIVDDNSSDKTVDIIRDFRDKRIKLFLNSENCGVIRSFEKSISLSSNEVIFLSDQDDIWMEQKVEFCLKKLDEGFDLIVSDAYIMNEGEIKLETFMETRNSGPGIAKNIFKNSFIGCCMVFRSSMRSKILPFPDSVPMHDVWIGLMITYFGKTLFVRERLIVYRRHTSNVTQMSHSGAINIVKNRKNLLSSLLSRIVSLKTPENRYAVNK